MNGVKASFLSKDIEAAAEQLQDRKTTTTIESMRMICLAQDCDKPVDDLSMFKVLLH